MSSLLSAVHESHRKPLVACIASMFALSAPMSVLAIPTTWPVSNCNSSGPGSLREVIAAATTMSGDTVDLSGLPDLPVPCSTITLTVGEIYIDQLNLKIKGPGASKLIIDGSIKLRSRVTVDAITKHGVLLSLGSRSLGTRGTS